MIENLRSEQGPDVLKREHLAEGVPPIMACVGIDLHHQPEGTPDFNSIKEEGEEVDLIDKHSEYVVSAIDREPKFTESLYNCTSVAAVGRENNSEELSFLTHQNPAEVVGEIRDSFKSELEERLKKMKERCQNRSIDVVITGGHFYEGREKEYPEFVEFLSKTVSDVLGFEPVVISGPKEGGSDNIYLDTAKRRLYVVRPYTKAHNDPFIPSQIRLK